MSDYNWCHGTNCHTQQTQSRVRGSGDNKVLRTRKIKVYNPNDLRVWDYFCNHACLMDYMAKHAEAVVSIESRREPLETPIKDPVKDESRHWNQWNIEKKVG